MKILDNKGFTLIEVLIALAIFAVISISMLQILQYTSQSSLKLFAKTDAFENARAAMDALLMNIQLADEITLDTGENGMLKKLILCELDPEEKPHNYIFYYDSSVSDRDEPKYHRLEFGLNDEFASQIGEILLVKEGRLINITVSTDGEAADAITLQSAIDISNKIFKGSGL